jgi:hypothetical protein
MERLPDLPDRMAAGMGLMEALAFGSRMVNTPGHPPTFWWDAVKAYRAASPETPTTSAASTALH